MTYLEVARLRKQAEDNMIPKPTPPTVNTRAKAPVPNPSKQVAPSKLAPAVRKAPAVKRTPAAAPVQKQEPIHVSTPEQYRFAKHLMEGGIDRYPTDVWPD